MAHTFKEQMAFEAGLKAGTKVTAFWTNNHFYWKAPAIVVRVNKASVRVRLTEDVGRVSGSQSALYAEGREIVCPLFAGSGYAKWSWNNCVIPEGAKPECYKGGGTAGEEEG